jgi:hypothetical protein
MKKLASAVAALASLLTTFGLGVLGCGGSSGGNPIIAAVIAPSFKSAPQADTTGQTDVFLGDLGAGTTCSFAAIQGVTYNISVSSNPDREDVIVDVFSKDGAQLKANTVTTNSGLNYVHTAASQHVLVVLRPFNPVNTDIEITKFQITGVGTFSQTALSINLIVAGDDYVGFGAFNDLATPQDRANFAAALVQRLQAIHNTNGTGIQFTFEGFTLTNAQIQSSQPALLDAQGRSICKTSEVVNSSGFANIDTLDLARWGTFGFPANDPTATRANGLDCFIVHHFSTDGIVGLSPRPGTLIRGNGADSALAVGAFVQLNGTTLTPRSVDDMAVVLTHEIGHFLGLLHTTTFSPSGAASAVKEAIDDGLADTPPAGTIADANSDGVVGIGDGCADQNNVMFYQSIATQSQLSPRQVSIMKTLLSSLAH